MIMVPMTMGDNASVISGVALFIFVVHGERGGCNGKKKMDTKVIVVIFCW